jgi:hypothetical protein
MHIRNETKFIGDAISVEVWTDGVKSQTQLMRAENCQWQEYGFPILGVDLDGGKYSPYVFSDLKICR